MNALVSRHATHVIGELSGWDRVIFRGTLRMLSFVGGMMGYLSRVGVLLKHFGDHGQAMTERLIDASLAAAQQADRPITYLESPKIRKDLYAREIAIKDGVQTGLICILTCVEPCKSYEIYRNRETKRLEFKLGFRFPFKSASTDGSGWHDAWTNRGYGTSGTTTAFPGLRILRKLKRSWIACTTSLGRRCSMSWPEG